MPTINIKPTWPEYMAMLIALLESGTGKGKEYARRELMALGHKLEAQAVGEAEVATGGRD